MSNRKWVFLFLFFILTFLAKAYYDTNTIEVRRYQIINSPLSEALKGIKLAHLSDLHIKTMGRREKKVLEILRKEAPEIIFFTGDLINFNGPYEPGISFTNNFQAPLGSYGVMGNTDYYNENGSCILCHEPKSRNLRKQPLMTYLRNNSITKTFGGEKISIVGVDDPVNARSDLKVAMNGVSPGTTTVLLAHSPGIFEEAVKAGIDMVFVGHTHGGQWWGVNGLAKFLPFESGLEYGEGFFQKGPTLMYVNRGIGTSFLPFRIGVKPEVTFFNFSGRETNRSNGGTISNSTSRVFFSGFSFSDFLDTFNVFPIVLYKAFHIDLNDLSNKIDQPDKTNLTGQEGGSTRSKTIFDFERPEELQKLNWECHKWMELTRKGTTSGKSALKVSLPPGQYPGLTFEKIPSDWSGARYFKMDVTNPEAQAVKFNLRIDDNRSGREYADRFDKTFILKPGLNSLVIPTTDIRTNLYPRPLNLKKIDRFLVFIPSNPARRDLYIDHIRLE